MSITLGSTTVTFNDSTTQATAAPKVRVLFDGTGGAASNQTLRSSSNVSSVYKNGTGDYTVNFSSALGTTAYCPVGTSTDTARDLCHSSIASGSYRFILNFYSTGNNDSAYISCVIFS